MQTFRGLTVKADRITGRDYICVFVRLEGQFEILLPIRQCSEFHKWEQGWNTLSGKGRGEKHCEKQNDAPSGRLYIGSRVFRLTAFTSGEGHEISLAGEPGSRQQN